MSIRYNHAGTMVPHWSKGRLVTRLRFLVRTLWLRLGRRRHSHGEIRPPKEAGGQEITVAVILSEATERCLAYEWRLVPLERNDWRQQIAESRPAFLFVEGAEAGDDRLWGDALARFEASSGHPLYDLILYCRGAGVPTVFWGTGDPAQFVRFKAAAAEFDYIFTIDAGSVGSYRAISGHDRVYLLPLAAQPALHNPSVGPRSDSVFLDASPQGDSLTVPSRRIFELLASGTNVVAPSSQVADQILPGLLRVAHTPEEGERALLDMAADPAAARRQAHVAYRIVMREHTYAHRASAIVSRVAPAHVSPVDDPAVTVVLVTNRPERLHHALDSYHRQSYGNRELVLVLNSDAFVRDDVTEALRGIEHVKLRQFPEKSTLAACLNKAIEVADGQYWAKFDDDDEYGREYLADALLPFRFTDASISGKGTYFARIAGEPGLYLRRAGREHRYVNFVCGGTLVVDREAVRDLKFNEAIARGADTEMLRRAFAHGHRIYSGDPYNFVQVRNLNPRVHTWRIDRDDYLRACVSVDEQGADIRRQVFF